MKPHNILLVSAISSIAALSSANAATALIDFGTPNAVPEPSSALLCSLAGLSLLARRR
jgi:hypothetical protein